MRTRAIWVVAGLILASFAGCSPLNQYSDPCRGNSATVSVGPGQLHMRPECLEIEAGGSIELRLRLADGVGDVMTRPAPANENAKWLSSSELRDGTIVLTAPSEKSGNDPCQEDVCEYKFEIIADKVGELDPRVRIRY